MLNIQYQSDSKIVTMIAQDQPKGWEYLYDKYSSFMYGIVFVMSKNKSIAEDIFFNLFLQLKKNREIVITQNARLCPFLMQETFIFARNELKRKGLDADTSTLGDTPKLIQLLCAKYCLPTPASEAINRDTIKKHRCQCLFLLHASF